MRMIFASLACALLVLLTLPGAGCQRAFSTGSADIPVDKAQTMFAGDSLTLNLPEQVDVAYSGEIPESVTVHGDVTIGLFAQRHSADSQHAIDAAVEAVNELRELLGIDADVGVAP